MSEEKAEYKTKKSEPKQSPKKFEGVVVTDFSIDGKNYRTGQTFSTTKQDHFKKLIRINKINKK